MFVKAYAKINLFLDVINKREDSFHTLLTVMQVVSLCDELEIDIITDNKGLIDFSCSEESLSGEDNLAYKAAKLYLDLSNISASVRIHLKKNIPVMAGLGGGSSDAAAVLRGLNRIFARFSSDELLSLAATLGSDVAFCLLGGCALCEGRGEILTPIKNVKTLYFVIAKGEAGISTPMAFKRLDEMYDDFKKPRYDIEEKKSQLLSKLSGGRFDYPDYYNIFESAVPGSLEDVGRLKSKMLEFGAGVALLCGSGPSVFGVFDKECDSVNAADSLKKEGYFAIATKSLGNSLL